MKLYYLFDFGDNWLFQISKTRHKEKLIQSGIVYSLVIEARSKNPEQYPDWGEGKEEMGRAKVSVICLASLFIFCCSDQMLKLPDYWEYAPGKWVAFKENIELEWKYDESKVDKFKIDRAKKVLKDDDIKEIIQLIRKMDIDGLVAKEISLRRSLKFDEKMENYNLAEEMNFLDKKEPIPTFGEIRFYSINAIKKYSISVPAGLSVILLDRSK